MKFVLFVEGHTEDKALPVFLKRWLDPKLEAPVGIQTVRFDGWSELFRDVAQKAKMHLNGPSKDKIIAVHEVEAWLLSQTDIFPPNIRKAFPGKVAKPETVNFNEPPAKLLDRLYKQYIKRNYKKTVNGRELFSQLDPAVAYEKCPHLREMLDKMLDLATDTRRKR
jgi:hypothetical protein